MAEKVAKLGLERDNNYMYYVKFDNSGGGVWRVARKQPGVPKGKPEKVGDFEGSLDTSFIYFLDKDGDVARARRQVGGKKRAKSAKAAKKATKKPAAKKPAAKKPAAKKPAAKKPAAKAKKPVKKKK